MATTAHAQSFPADEGLWESFICNREPMIDRHADEPMFLGASDLVGDIDGPAGERAADANFLYLRLRVDADPLPTAQPPMAAWGYEFDTDNNPTTYEVIVLVDRTAAGQGNVVVLRNTMTTTPNSPADPAEMQVQLFPIASHARSRVAIETLFGGTTDYWLELAVPWSTLMPLGITPTSRLRVWAASSSMNDRLDGDFACHDGATGDPTLDLIDSDQTVLDPIIDTDGDGVPDADEVAAGTDPNDPNSRPESSRLEGGGGCSTRHDNAWALLLVIAIAIRARRRARGSR